jgi:ABC-type uncharacterized transport system YnjBCD ATPase subunit
MPTPTWPADLPQAPNKDFTETGGVLLGRTNMDMGPAKQRRLGMRPRTAQVQFLMNNTQVSILENFINHTLYGTRRFEFVHPRTGAVELTRIIPSGDGQLYQIGYLGGATGGGSNVSYYNIQMQLEFLP